MSKAALTTTVYLNAVDEHTGIESPVTMPVNLPEFEVKVPAYMYNKGQKFEKLVGKTLVTYTVYDSKPGFEKSKTKLVPDLNHLVNSVNMPWGSKFTVGEWMNFGMSHYRVYCCGEKVAELKRNPITGRLQIV